MTIKEVMKAKEIAIAKYRARKGKGPMAIDVKEMETFVRVTYDNNPMDFVFISLEDLK